MQKEQHGRRAEDFAPRGNANAVTSESYAVFVRVAKKEIHQAIRVVVEIL